MRHRQEPIAVVAEEELLVVLRGAAQPTCLAIDAPAKHTLELYSTCTVCKVVLVDGLSKTGIRR